MLHSIIRLWISFAHPGPLKEAIHWVLQCRRINVFWLWRQVLLPANTQVIHIFYVLSTLHKSINIAFFSTWSVVSQHLWIFDAIVAHTTQREWVLCLYIIRYGSLSTNESSVAIISIWTQDVSDFKLLLRLPGLGPWPLHLCHLQHPHQLHHGQAKSFKIQLI